MGSDERMLALSGTEQGGQGMSVRKQTGARCPGDGRQEAGATLRELGGCQNPEVLSLRRPGREHN